MATPEAVGEAGDSAVAKAYAGVSTAPATFVSLRNWGNCRRVLKAAIALFVFSTALVYNLTDNACIVMKTCWTFVVLGDLKRDLCFFQTVVA